MVLTICRKVNFCAGHRLLGHEGLCAGAHGHNYTAYFTAKSEGELDSLGRVIDFGVFKDRLLGWLNEHWDHAFIVWERDLELRELLQRLSHQRIFVLPDNPTAENMAKYLLAVVGPSVLAGTGVRLVKVQLWETENCCAEVCEELQ